MVLIVYNYCISGVFMSSLSLNFERESQQMTSDFSSLSLFSVFLRVSGPMDEVTFLTHLYLLQVMLGLQAAVVKYSLFSMVFQGK